MSLNFRHFRNNVLKVNDFHVYWREVELTREVDKVAAQDMLRTDPNFKPKPPSLKTFLREMQNFIQVIDTSGERLLYVLENAMTSQAKIW